MPDNLHHQPLIEVAIEPKSKADHEKLGLALAKLAAEDASFQVSIDHESGQTILKGMSEAQLAAKIDILKGTYKVDANIGALQVAFRERPTQSAVVEYTYKRDGAWPSGFAAVKILVEPNEIDAGYRFEDKTSDGALREYILGVKKGIESVLGAGVVAGFPVVDVKVELIDAKYHDVRSSNLAFEIATRAAFREALQRAKSVLLEPIMKVEVTTPREYARGIEADFPRRRPQVQRTDERGETAVISATVPLMNMFGYDANLRAMSHGRATYTMQFDHYAVAPANVSGDDPSPFSPAIGMRA